MIETTIGVIAIAIVVLTLVFFIFTQSRDHAFLRMKSKWGGWDITIKW
jgi:hypothetical protein